MFNRFNTVRECDRRIETKVQAVYIDCACVVQ